MLSSAAGWDFFAHLEQSKRTQDKFRFPFVRVLPNDIQETVLASTGSASRGQSRRTWSGTILISRIRNLLIPFGLTVLVAGCSKPAADPAASARVQAMPVQTITVQAAAVPQSDEYVATIKSRRSATLTPQVDGNLTKILARSGDRVKAGQVLMLIDPIKQQATFDAQVATENQKLAVYQYNQVEVERQRKLFNAGVTSHDALDQAEQAYRNSKADYESSIASRKTQASQLGYYQIRAPFDGVVGDIPVHVGDYVSSTIPLTTVDENGEFEAYIYIPSERAAQVRRGLPVDILDNSGKLIERAHIDFVSPQVDNGLQGILAKAMLRSGAGTVRNAQLVKASVIWSTVATPTVPVLAISRLGGQAFVYIVQHEQGKAVARQRPVQLGDTVGNDYAVVSGLHNGDQVIVSGTQLLVDGAPVQPAG
jgi:RND family efflux transporter MFP subunit